MRHAESFILEGDADMLTTLPHEKTDWPAVKERISNLVKELERDSSEEISKILQSFDFPQYGEKNNKRYGPCVGNGIDQLSKSLLIFLAELALSVSFLFPAPISAVIIGSESNLLF